MSRGVAPHAVRRRMNKETQMMLVPQGSIEGYIRAANEYPMLTAEEEKSLAERLYYEGDIEADEKISFITTLRFVIHVARGYSGYGLPQADLIQEGNIGLMKAVKRFNPERGRSPCIFCGALDQSRNPRICPSQLAYCESRDHESAT